VWGSNPGTVNRVFCSAKYPDQLWGLTSLLFNDRRFLPVVKRPERKVNHSRLSSAEVKNDWSHTSSPPIRIHGVDRDNFAFILFT
jgi:hypothetical protein